MTQPRFISSNPRDTRSQRLLTIGKVMLTAIATTIRIEGRIVPADDRRVADSWHGRGLHRQRIALEDLRDHQIDRGLGIRARLVPDAADRHAFPHELVA